MHTELFVRMYGKNVIAIRMNWFKHFKNSDFERGFRLTTYRLDMSHS